MKKIIDKSEELYDLHKIPDKEMVEMLIIEVRKLKSYIQELECANQYVKNLFNDLQKKYNKEKAELKQETQKEMMKEGIIKKLRKEHNKELKELRKKVALYEPLVFEGLVLKPQERYTDKIKLLQKEIEQLKLLNAQLIYKIHTQK